MCYEWIFSPLQKQEHKYKNCQSDLMNVLCVSIPAFIVINTKPFLTHTQAHARRAMDFLWEKRQRNSNLVGTTINIHSGEWVRRGETGRGGRLRKCEWNNK